MIKAKKEARALRIWLTCVVIFICLCLVGALALGIYTSDMVYDLLPFLDFGLTLEGEIFGVEIPAFITDNFNFGVTMACLMAAVVLAVLIIYWIVLGGLKSQRKRAKRVLKRNGYCKEYFDLLERKRKKLSGSWLSAENDLLLAKEYCDGRCYDNAFAVLRDIDLDGFDSKLAANYYVLYSQLFVLTGDVDGAKATLSLGEPFVSKLKNKSELKLVKSLIKYAEGDYTEAKKGFKELLQCKPVETRVWAGMYLGLIYLRQHKKEHARKLAVALGEYKKTPRQSEDMLKLLKKIEAAYAIEAEERATEKV